MVQLTLHRCLGGAGFSSQELDLTDFGLVPGRDYHGETLAASDERASVDHVHPVGQGESRVRERLGSFDDRETLSREGRFIDAQTVCCNEARVRRHVAAGLQYQ